MKKTLLLGLLLCCLSVSSFAQDLGLNPPNLKWYQIKTDYVQVVFPEGLQERAQRVVNLVHYMIENNQSNVGPISEPVTIFLQNQTTISNGFVAVSPFRSEFFTTPPQFNFSGTAEWLDLLAIHEYRHVQQNQNAKVGITKLASIVFGQNGWGFMTGMAVPRWYSEGDAVIAETAYTHSGRGKTPDFDKEYRAMRLENGKYSYEKASATSLKHYVPDHYHLGYNMVSYARNEFGKDVWAKVLNGSGKYKGLFYTFSHNLKKETGLGTKELYEATMNRLDSLYKADLESLTLTSSTQINTLPKKKFTSYRNPQFLNDHQVIVEKSSFDEIRSFYILDKNGKEEKLLTAGLNVDLNNTLSVKNGKMTWSELTFHPRWFNQDYVIIKTADAATGDNRTKVTKKTKLFSPDLSNDAQKIAAIEVSTDLKYSLNILDATTGQVIKQLPNPDNYFLSFPRWSIDDQHIIVVANKDNQNTIAQINVETGEMTSLTPNTYEQLSNPFPHKDYIFFASSYTGINNIFAVKKGTTDIYQVTSTKFGAFQPAISPNGEQLAFSEYTSLGYDLKIMEIKPETWTKMPAQEDISNLLQVYKIAEEQEEGAILEKIEEETFPVKRYNKLSGVLQLHSWNPIVNDPFDPEGGIEIEIDNKFTTLSATAGYIYNANEETGRFYTELAYGQFWPILRVGYTGNSERIAQFSAIYGRFDSSDPIDTAYYIGYNNIWEENKINAGITLPFNLTSGNMLTNMNISVDYEHINVDYSAPSFPNDLNRPNDDATFGAITSPPDEKINALDFNLALIGNRQTALQNIYPKFGYFLGIRHRRTIGNSFGQDETTLLRGRLFLPGFAKNHGFLVLGQYQFGQVQNTYNFINQFANPRGYRFAQLNDRASRFSVNYAFPIIYPDVAIGSFAFIQRIKGTAFFDMANFQRDPFGNFEVPGRPRPFRIGNISNTLKSVGLEITTDFRAFRLLDIDLGVRYSYLLDPAIAGETTAHSFEFLLVRISP